MACKILINSLQLPAVSDQIKIHVQPTAPTSADVAGLTPARPDLQGLEVHTLYIKPETLAIAYILWASIIVSCTSPRMLVW